MARQSPDDFVMKPQMEGGGANLFGADMVAALNTMSVEERSAHILMQRIHPPTAMVSIIPFYGRMRTLQTYMIARNVAAERQPVEAVHELGIYGTLLGDLRTGEILVSE